MKRTKTILLAALTGLLVLFACLGAGLAVTLAARGLYTSGIAQWNLEAVSGLSRAEILENYDALMAWCSPLYTQPLALPSLPMSAGGAAHFQECKPLFNGVLLLGLVALPCLAALTVWAVRRRQAVLLWGGGAVSLALPCALLGACAVDFDRAFVLFHRVFFRNDLWLFDYRTDPVILILPEAYFLRCAVMICAAVVLGGGAFLAAGVLLRRRWAR